MHKLYCAALVSVALTGMSCQKKPCHNMSQSEFDQQYMEFINSLVEFTVQEGIQVKLAPNCRFLKNTDKAARKIYSDFNFISPNRYIIRECIEQDVAYLYVFPKYIKGYFNPNANQCEPMYNPYNLPMYKVTLSQDLDTVIALSLVPG